MTTAVTVASQDAAGNSYQITAAATSPTTASVSLSSWKPGRSFPAYPDVRETYALDNVRAVGDTMLCQTQVLLVSADVVINLSGFGQLPSVSIGVQHVWFTNTANTYPLSQADHDALSAWIKASAFPAP